MQYQSGIPEDELKQFQPYLHVYPVGKTIIQEGDTDQRIFLLRKGEVDVFKKVGEDLQQLGKIEAVNFFGEMAIISHRPRTASIIAASDPVVVYEFENPNLPSIMAHPKWGIALLKRLTDNLEERHRSYEAAQKEFHNLKTEIAEMLGALVSFFPGVETDEENLDLLNTLLHKLFSFHMRNMDIQIKIPETEQLEVYYRLGIVTEEIYELALNSRNNFKDNLD